MKKELICVICPNGCQLQAEIQEGDRPAVTNVTGNLCDKGPEWARQEIVNPMRTIASSVLVEDGDLPMVSVRTDSPIPLKKIFEVMKEIKAARVNAPVRIGDVIIEKVAGLTCNIIATRNVKKTEDGRLKAEDRRQKAEG
jgi:CxxC motif-containing protein